MGVYFPHNNNKGFVTFLLQNRHNPLKLLLFFFFCFTLIIRGFFVTFNSLFSGNNEKRKNQDCFQVGKTILGGSGKT